MAATPDNPEHHAPQILRSIASSIVPAFPTAADQLVGLSVSLKDELEELSLLRRHAATRTRLPKVIDTQSLGITKPEEAFESVQTHIATGGTELEDSATVETEVVGSRQFRHAELAKRSSRSPRSGGFAENLHREYAVICAQMQQRLEEQGLAHAGEAIIEIRVSLPVTPKNQEKRPPSSVETGQLRPYTTIWRGKGLRLTEQEHAVFVNEPDRHKVIELADRLLSEQYGDQP